jgi:hypothetical protein
MDSNERKLTRPQVAEARKRRLEVQHTHTIESNPLDAEDVAMFEMFEREQWSHERRLQYILDQARLNTLAGE